MEPRTRVMEVLIALNSVGISLNLLSTNLNRSAGCEGNQNAMTDTATSTGIKNGLTRRKYSS